MWSQFNLAIMRFYSLVSYYPLFAAVAPAVFGALTADGVTHIELRGVQEFYNSTLPSSAGDPRQMWNQSVAIAAYNALVQAFNAARAPLPPLTVLRTVSAPSSHAGGAGGVARARTRSPSHTCRAVCRMHRRINATDTHRRRRLPPVWRRRRA